VRFLTKKNLLLCSMLLFQGMAFGDDAPAAPKVDSGDSAWILVSTALVFFMTPGLGLFYGGMVRTKNVLSTIFQSYAAIAFMGVLWAVCGYSLAFSGDIGGVIGNMNFAFLNGVGQEPNADYAATIPHILFALFQCMFAVITPALITGAIAERINFKGWIAFMIAWSLIVYSPVAHWVWGVGGWIRGLGALDFAGGMVVHMTAGYSAIVATILMGKRKDPSLSSTNKAYDPGMVLVGAGILVFGWFGFNGGSALASGALASHAFGTTFFAAAASMAAWMIYDVLFKGKFSAIGAACGVVSGLVVITPAAGFVTIQSSLLIGVLAGIICNFAITKVKSMASLDDSLDVFGCHGVGGTLGTILTGVLASKSVNGAGADGGAALLKANLMGAGAVIVWSVIGTVICFGLVKIVGGLRASTKDENQGLDLSQHGEAINSNFEGKA
jgi:ammonium transporter, Amt family